MPSKDRVVANDLRQRSGLVEKREETVLKLIPDSLNISEGARLDRSISDDASELLAKLGVVHPTYELVVGTKSSRARFDGVVE